MPCRYACLCAAAMKGRWILGGHKARRGGCTTSLRGHVRGAGVGGFQMYRGLSIATAKVTEEEAKGVKHHLLDYLEPTDQQTVVEFGDAAKKIISPCLLHRHATRRATHAARFPAALCRAVCVESNARGWHASVSHVCVSLTPSHPRHSRAWQAAHCGWRYHLLRSVAAQAWRLHTRRG